MSKGGGGQGGYDPPLSPRSPHPLPPLREVKIGKIFEIVTQECNKTQNLGPPPEFQPLDMYAKWSLQVVFGSRV